MSMFIFLDDQFGSQRQEDLTYHNNLYKKTWKRAIEEKMVEKIKLILDEREYSSAPQ